MQGVLPAGQVVNDFRKVHRSAESDTQPLQQSVESDQCPLVWSELAGVQPSMPRAHSGTTPRALVSGFPKLDRTNQYVGAINPLYLGRLVQEHRHSLITRKPNRPRGG